MTDRERLIELLQHFADGTYTGDGWIVDSTQVDDVADYLLANGVIVPPCKVGDVVYILDEKCKFSGEKNMPWDSCRQYWDNVFKNKMWGCAGKDEKGNVIYCKQKEMVWYAKQVEYSLLLYSDPTIVLGESLFLTKEEAEQALKEREQNDR